MQWIILSISKFTFFTCQKKQKVFSWKCLLDIRYWVVDSGLTWVQVSSLLRSLIDCAAQLDIGWYWILEIGWYWLVGSSKIEVFCEIPQVCHRLRNPAWYWITFAFNPLLVPQPPKCSTDWIFLCPRENLPKKELQFFFTSNHHSDFCLVAVFSLSRSARTSSISVYLSSCRNNFVLSIYYPVTLLCPHSPVRKI